ncbi:hypothetical protein [Pseudothauera rhizosphaerae]|uniref:hypothetical protein n=1 Tax=Pseudothauera rhizosphaerae TaxID=2565932 RepID=UPI001B3B1C44|nr:hypothetical protein [Pseudothauera rhizosphaerae]
MAYAVKHARKSTAHIVLEAVQDLHAKEQIVTRETLAEVTGMKLVVIDDRLSYLTDNGNVRRVQRGVYVPVEQHKPARLITRTLLPDGTTVLEIGDETALVLTPREARMVGELMVGSAQQYAAIQIGQEVERQNNALRTRISELRRGVDQLIGGNPGVGLDCQFRAADDASSDEN